MSEIVEVELEYKPVALLYRIFSWVGCYIYPQTIIKNGKNYIILLKEDGINYQDKINKFIIKVVLNCFFFSLFFSLSIISIIVYL